MTDPIQPASALPASDSPPHHANRLIREKSPYLQQHAHNPVDWHPWGALAFEHAQRENKPIFLSIGYSTCHWCHVMERESFEDEEVADFLNRHFVSIKVDREERPDVDRIYMTAVQAMAGQGGWPLSVFLTPSLKPFYGGTYFPPISRSGLPGFLDLLQQVQSAWHRRRAEIERSAAEFHQHLARALQPSPASGAGLSADLIRLGAGQLKKEFDPQHGGFGRIPKFPRPSTPLFLLAYGHAHRDAEAIQMVRSTCEAMAAGGIYDQLGGGFARYAVDPRWEVPHFEKMLYDNAQLANLYLDAFLAARIPRFAEIARETIAYVLRDLSHHDGGFFSAEDADSEGKEGKFYCWTLEEIESLLSPDQRAVAIRYFGVTPKGNFVDHSDPQPLLHLNVLRIADPRLSPEEASTLVEIRACLLAARGRRIRPLRDDKILASWNGLMLGALARASAVLPDPHCLDAARRNLAFIQFHLWDRSSSKLYHRWCDGERDQTELLSGYAAVLDGTVSLYEASLDPGALEFALALAQRMIDRFYDPDRGGFWQSPLDTPDLILPVKEDYDGAEPSGNALAALALLRLGAIAGRTDFTDAAGKTLHLFAPRLRQNPQSAPHLLLAAHFSMEEPVRVVIAGPAGHPATRALIEAAHSVYAGRRVVLGVSGPVDPFACSLPERDGQPAAYLCAGHTCREPASDPARLAEQLRALTPGPAPQSPIPDPISPGP